ncbi:KGK domain-containing protein [Chamaesiphon polymorphus]|nr:KGK domain-containing protein [Chamaesiphon polymorphus]
MTEISKQIIPDSQAVARCLDPEMLEILDSHGTFILSELLEMLKGASSDPTAFRDELRDMIIKIPQRGHSSEYLLDKVVNFIQTQEVNESKDISSEIVRESLLDGMNCNLLQPDGKGWQKGKLKLCFEFIPEEPETVATQEKPGEAQPSPLDEIRQLANELTSMTSTEQN